MPIRSRYRWNAKAGRYIDVLTGRFVSREVVRAEVDAALDAARRRALSISNLLRERGVTLEIWRSEMRQIVKEVHLYSMAAAEGGWAQLSPADYGRVGRIVRDEYAWLENFAQEIESGEQLLDGTLLSRATLYTEAGRMTFHLTERATMVERGMTEEFSKLNPADHCVGCVEENEKGWGPIGSHLPIGRRICGRRCKCDMLYR